MLEQEKGAGAESPQEDRLSGADRRQSTAWGVGQGPVCQGLGVWTIGSSSGKGAWVATSPPSMPRASLTVAPSPHHWEARPAGARWGLLICRARWPRPHTTVVLSAGLPGRAPVGVETHLYPLTWTRSGGPEQEGRTECRPRKGPPLPSAPLPTDGGQRGWCRPASHPRTPSLTPSPWVGGATQNPHPPPLAPPPA